MVTPWNAHAREKGVWKREQKAWRADFVVSAPSGWRVEGAQERGAIMMRRVAKDALYDEMGRRQRALHACVDKLRAEREVRDQKLAVARELRDALQAEQAAERQAIEREEQRRAKDLILQYRAEQFRAEAERKLVEAAARKERERVQREQAKHGAERARYREGVREAQRSEKEKALERLARADEARAIALEALARTVPYFEAISTIESDVTKTTAAVEAQRADQRTAADKTGCTTGLTDERVFRDPAFKVGLAMRSLGVARTGAARDAVARLVGPRAMNPITGARVKWLLLCVCLSETAGALVTGAFRDPFPDPDRASSPAWRVALSGLFSSVFRRASRGAPGHLLYFSSVLLPLACSRARARARRLAKLAGSASARERTPLLSRSTGAQSCAIACRESARAIWLPLNK